MRNEEISVEQLVKEITKKVDIIETFKDFDEIITCGVCYKESKISRNKFDLETLDAKTMCSGCEIKQPVKIWQCACNKPWYQCENIAEQAKFLDA